MQYTIKSLLELAEMFERRAKDEHARAQKALTKKEAEWNRGAAAAYSDVARIIRATTLENK